MRTFGRPSHHAPVDATSALSIFTPSQHKHPVPNTTPHPCPTPQLEGFDGFLREQRDAASALEKLVQLLHALHPSGSPSMQQYAARLSRDAAAALKVAAPPGEPLDLRLFLEVLTCCGHEGWLRTGKAPDAADGAGGAGGSPRRSFPGSTSSIGRLSGGGANPLLSAPRHTFVVVRAPAMPASEGAAGDGCMLVVDPHFKQQFPSASIAASSPVYASLVEALPELVIGTAEGMGPLIKFLCEQVREAGSCEPLGACS